MPGKRAYGQGLLEKTTAPVQKPSYTEGSRSNPRLPRGGGICPERKENLVKGEGNLRRSDLLPSSGFSLLGTQRFPPFQGPHPGSHLFIPSSTAGTGLAFVEGGARKFPRQLARDRSVGGDWRMEVRGQSTITTSSHTDWLQANQGGWGTRLEGLEVYTHTHTGQSPHSLARRERPGS